eukprot:TRINITY_DN71065_c0_g1_i1.p1 TRINITY_DN71065_c0_g1~~TRINITY_DN71065_c0_g1_i1.p1  ORF type:complete len:355 (-),score=17.39 TRINITY_DN71065_c0_g1_i1:48-1112(-)
MNPFRVSCAGANFLLLQIAVIFWLIAIPSESWLEGVNGGGGPQFSMSTPLVQDPVTLPAVNYPIPSEAGGEVHAGLWWLCSEGFSFWAPEADPSTLPEVRGCQSYDWDMCPWTSLKDEIVACRILAIFSVSFTFASALVGIFTCLPQQLARIPCTLCTLCLTATALGCGVAAIAIWAAGLDSSSIDCGGESHSRVCSWWRAVEMYWWPYFSYPLNTTVGGYPTDSFIYAYPYNPLRSIACRLGWAWWLALVACILTFLALFAQATVLCCGADITPSATTVAAAEDVDDESTQPESETRERRRRRRQRQACSAGVFPTLTGPPASTCAASLSRPGYPLMACAPPPVALPMGYSVM